MIPAQIKQYTTEERIHVMGILIDRRIYNLFEFFSLQKSFDFIKHINIHYILLYYFGVLFP